MYLFGVDYDGSNANMKDMVNDLQPDHILLAVCKERGDKLLDTISKGDNDKNSGNSSISYFPPFNCQSFIRPDPPNEQRHEWKTTSIAKDVITKCGLIYGNEYFDALIEGQKINAKFIWGDAAPIQSVVDSIELFMNKVEDEMAVTESKKKKLHAASEKNIGITPKGRAKASKSFYTRAQAETMKEIAKLDKLTVVDLNNVSSVFVDKEFMEETYPDLFKTLYEDRDDGMFEHIKSCGGDVIFAVTPSIHVGGITDRLVADEAMLLF